MRSLHKFSINTVAFSALAVSLSSSAIAAQVTGMASITLDNPAVLSSLPASTAGWYFSKHWGPGNESLEINGSTTGGTDIASTEEYSFKAAVNSNATTVTTSTAGAGRTLQATDMDTSNTSNGQIGLNGAMRMNHLTLTTYLAPYDFSVKKMAGQWGIYSFDSAFSTAQLFNINNVNEGLDIDGNLLLSGDLYWPTAGFNWNGLLSGDTQIKLGEFSLAPAPVPLPGAALLFAGGLMSLFPALRKKVKA